VDQAFRVHLQAMVLRDGSQALQSCMEKFFGH
jgi:hypothetical protein